MKRSERKKRRGREVNQVVPGLLPYAGSGRRDKGMKGENKGNKIGTHAPSTAFTVHYKAVTEPSHI